MDALVERIVEVWRAMPPALSALLILPAGWLFARFVRFAVARLLAALKVDKLAERTGFAEFLRKGEVEYSPSRLGGAIAYWIVILAVCVAIARSLDVRFVEALSDRIVELFPSVLAAVIVLAIGAMLVTFASNFARTIARNAAWPHAELIARVMKYAGNTILVLVALEQAGLASSMLSRLLQILFAAIVVALALAFGLGCKDLARGAAERFIENLRERDRGSKGSDLEG